MNKLIKKFVTYTKRQILIIAAMNSGLSRPAAELLADTCMAMGETEQRFDAAIKAKVRRGEFTVVGGVFSPPRGPVN